MASRRLPLSLAAAAVGVACGSFGETKSSPAGSDASTGTDASAGADAVAVTDGAPSPLPARRCVVGAPFISTVPVTIDENVESARFSSDGTTAYLALFPSGMTKTATQLVTARVAQDGTIGARTLHPVSAIGFYDSNLMLSPDGQVAMFATDRGAPGPALFVAAYEQASGGFGTGMRLTLPSGMAVANEPYLLRDGKTMYFAASAPPGNDYDIFRASGPPPAYGASSGELVTAVSGTEQDNAPVVTEDELEMFFTTNRANSDFDIWAATRTSADAPTAFKPPSKVDTLSTKDLEYPTWISPDACELYIVRKTATSGVLLRATRQTP